MKCTMVLAGGVRIVSMHPQETHLIYEFGDFELDALRRVLVSRDDGQQVEVSSRALEELRRNLHTAPFLKALHADPRWQELLERIEAE